MKTDIDRRLWEWGNWVRERQDYGLGYPRRTVIHKAMREGPGARQSSGYVEIQMPAPVEQMEQALCMITGGLRETAIQRYVRQSADKVAAERMRISVAQYRQRIDQLHYYIAGALGEETA